MLNKFQAKLNAAGITAEIVKFCAGSYFDGTQTDHAYYYDRLCIDPETWTENEIANRAVKRLLRGEIKQLYTIERVPFSMGFYITATADRARANEAAAEATAFLDAFWQYLSDNAPKTPDGKLFNYTDADQHREMIDNAIRAGHEAVKKHQEGRKAA